MKVLLIAAPLVTTGGVYRSTQELVVAARNAGLDWSAVIVLRGNHRLDAIPDGVEVTCEEDRGLKGLAHIRSLLSDIFARQEIDVVISMLPQCDVLLATIPRPRGQLRVAFVRGAAWPQPGESALWKRLVWRALERVALRRMDEVWTTTPVLREEIAWPAARIVPAGIAGSGTANHISEGQAVVWAARMSVDKNPELFLTMMSNVNVTGKMFGDGEMRPQLTEQASANVTLPGWTDPAQLWKDAMVYVGTSFREAFGRSAVEAAMHGIPVILSKAFGAAPLLYTDPSFAQKFVLDPTDTNAWINALDALTRDQALREEVGAHVKANALKLTIESSVAAVNSHLTHLAQTTRHPYK